MKKLLMLLVLSLTLFLSGCNILENRIKKVNEAFENVAKEVNYDTVFVTENEVVLNSQPFDLMDVSYKFLKDKGYKLGKISKSDDTQIGDTIIYKNYIYYSLRYDKKRIKSDLDEYAIYTEKMVVLRMNYTTRNIKILKDVDDMGFYKYSSAVDTAPYILEQIDDKYFLIVTNYKYELYSFEDFKLIQTITLTDDPNIQKDDNIYRYGTILYDNNKYYNDIYCVKPNVLEYYEFKDGIYNMHLIPYAGIHDIKSAFSFEKLGNKVLLENVLAFNLEDDSLLDLQKVTNEINQSKKPVPEEIPSYEVQNIKFKIGKINPVEFKLVREDESTDLINVELFNQNKAYLEISKLLTGDKDHKIETDRLEYFISDNRLFFHTWHISSFSGLWNTKSFVFEYDLNNKKLVYVGCIPLNSDILKIDVIN